MQAGESINDLARLFYPKNKYMQQQFSAATLKLNRGNLPVLTANQPFSQISTIQIPDIKALSKKGKRAPAKPAQSENQATSTPSLATGNDAATESHDQSPLAYDALVKRNAFLKTELEQLNAKIAQLQEVLNALQKELEQLTVTEPEQTHVVTAEKNITLEPNVKAEPEVAHDAKAHTEATPSTEPAAMQVHSTEAAGTTPATTQQASKQASAADSANKPPVEQKENLRSIEENSYVLPMLVILIVLLLAGVFVEMVLRRRRQVAKIKNNNVIEVPKHPFEASVFKADPLDITLPVLKKK